MKHLVISLMIAAIVPAGATIAFAAGQKGGPCKEDRQKFCADAKPGGGAIRDCLNQHKDELSDTCKELLSKKAGAKSTAPAGGAASSGGAAGDSDKAQ